MTTEGPGGGRGFGFRPRFGLIMTGACTESLILRVPILSNSETAVMELKDFLCWW